MSGGVKLIVGSILVLFLALTLVGLLLKAAKVAALVAVGALVLGALALYLKARR